MHGTSDGGYQCHKLQKCSDFLFSNFKKDTGLLKKKLSVYLLHYLQDTLSNSVETQTPRPVQFASSLQSATSLQLAPKNPVEQRHKLLATHSPFPEH